MNTRPIKGMVVVCINDRYSAVLQEGRRYKVAKTEKNHWDRFGGAIAIITTIAGNRRVSHYWADRFVTPKEYACSNAKRYKGIRPPACNGGDPCRSCVRKYWSTRGGALQ